MSYTLLSTSLVVLSFSTAFSRNMLTGDLCENNGGPMNCKLFGKSATMKMFVNGITVNFMKANASQSAAEINYDTDGKSACDRLSIACSTLISDGQPAIPNLPRELASAIQFIYENCHTHLNCSVSAPRIPRIDETMNIDECTGQGELALHSMQIYLECGFPTTTTTTTTTSTTTTTPPTTTAVVENETTSVPLSETGKSGKPIKSTTFKPIKDSKPDSPIEVQAENVKSGGDGIMCSRPVITILVACMMSLWIAKKL